MPPKSKYSREEITEKAIEIIKKYGYEKLTARELAAALGTSAKPVFTAFKNMDDVKQSCFDYAYALYHSYFKDGLGAEPFKQIGKTYVNFAKNEPELFKVVFLDSQKKAISFSNYMKKLDDNYDDTIKMIMDTIKIDCAKAEEMYKNMWIYSTGIAVLAATNQCIFSDDEIENMLENAFKSLESGLN